MYGRHSLYREIHKGLRHLLLDAVVKAGRTDFTDAAAVAELRVAVHEALDLLSSHAHHEDQWILPLLETHAPALARRNDTEHEEQELVIYNLRRAVDALDPEHRSVADAGHSFVVSFSHFTGELMIHMAEEEQILMPALWDKLTDEQLLEVEHALVSSIAPEKMAKYLPWMFGAINMPERVAMLSGAEANAPAEVFGMLRGIAASVLSPAEDAALEAQLNAARASMALPA